MTVQQLSCYSSHGLKHSLLMRLCFNTAVQYQAMCAHGQLGQQKSNFELEEGLLRQQACICAWIETARTTARS